MTTNILSCIFVTALYLCICRDFTAYDPTCLSRKLYITTENKYLRLLLKDRYRGRRKTPEEDWSKFSILGLATYAALLPALLAFCAKTFNAPYVNTPAGFSWRIYVLAVLFVHFLDAALGHLLLRHSRIEEKKSHKSVGAPKAILWSGTELEQIRHSAEAILHSPDKIIWDTDEQEYYFLQGENLLRLSPDGAFISLAPDADSSRVLKAMRTGCIIRL